MQVYSSIWFYYYEHMNNNNKYGLAALSLSLFFVIVNNC